jgi:hypothetical protein
VADVARAPVDAAVELSVDDDAAADAGADLDVEEVGDAPGDPGVLLADREHVDVVVEDHRAAELAGDRVADRVPVPARHDRRRHRDPAVEVDRPGDADARAHGPVHAHLGEHLADALEGGGEDLLRSPADVGGAVAGGEHVQPAVGHPDGHPGGADRDADEADVGGEVDERGAPATARGRRPGLLGEAELGEPGHLGGDGGPGDLESVGQLRLRERPLIAQLGEQPGLHGALGPARQGMTHGGILARRP